MAKAVEEKVVFESYKKEILKASEEEIYNALNAIGEAAEGHAKSHCPVDTGRLADSITYATAKEQGQAGGQAQDGDATKLAEPEDFYLYIGTNVEYAQPVEYRENVEHGAGTGAHFLRNSLSENMNYFESIFEAKLKAIE